MINNNNHGTRFSGFVPGMIVIAGDTQTENVMFDLPNGGEAAVQIRTQLEDPESRAQHRAEFFENVYPPSLTEGLEKDLGRMIDQFNDFSGYDKSGAPIMRLQGREREVLEMKISNRRNALATAKRDRAYAERVQAGAQQAKAATQQRITQAAEIRAQELIDSAEIERRAKQIAGRAGVR